MRKHQVFAVLAIVAAAAGINVAAYKMGAHSAQHPTGVYKLHLYRPAVRSPILVYRSSP